MLRQINTSASYNAILLSAISLTLAACGGGGASTAAVNNAPANQASASSFEDGYPIASDPLTLKNDPTCVIQYTPNTATEQAGPDPLLNNQWHLKNTAQLRGKLGEDINVEAAWKITTGEGVRIALVDDALEVTHSDLKSNVVTGASYNYRPAIKGSAFPLPCTKADGHGTSVAGIIASRASNNIGTVGIAPKAQLVGYNALSLDLTADIADALNRDMALNSIYHNSWGSPDTGEVNEAEPEFNQAIARGIKEGRSGKGSIFVFPAGNGGCYEVTGVAGCQRDNANFDGYINRLGVITVGALDQQGRSPWYAEQGSNILISAPAGDSLAGITTTAIANTYRSDFIGTSASAPMASGVIALMLSVNPQLTWRDVPIILARSARMNDPTDTGWSARFNHKYGFGALDATAAVNMAKSWITVGGTSTLKICTTTVSGVTDLPDTGAPLSSTAALLNCGISAIEHVAITVQVDHEYAGDLAIDLFSPTGTVSNLATPRRCETNDRANNTCGSFLNWQFGSVRHLDERASGNWNLAVKDTVTGKSGKLLGWTITVRGR